jgi:hypothetical protein
LDKSIVNSIALLALATATPALAEWRVAESEHFEIYSQEKEADVVDFSSRLERFDMLLTYFSRVKQVHSGPKLKVYWVRNATQVQEIIGDGSGLIQGYYVTATPYGAINVTPDDTTERGSRHVGSNQVAGIKAETVLLHEYSHHFMLQNFPVAFPAWFVEGFAEYYGNTIMEKNGDIRLGAIADSRVPGIDYFGLLKLETLFDAGANLKSGEKIEQFYGTSWLLTHYLNFDPARRIQLTNYLADVSAGTGSVAAAEKNFKGGIAGLRKDLDAYWRAGNLKYQTLGNVKMVDKATIKVSIISADRADAMISEIRYMSGFSSDPAERKKLIGKVGAAIKTYPGSAPLKAFLANLYLDNDEDAAAVDLASAALAIDPTNQRAMVVKATALMEQAQTLEGANTKRPDPVPAKKSDEEGVAADTEIIVVARRNSASLSRWADALKLISKSNRAHPEDPLPLYLYYEYLKRRGEPINDTALDGLAKAHVTLPQYSPFRFALAKEYSAIGDHVAAAGVVKAEAYSPHGGPDRRRARQLLKRYECLAADPKAACEFKEESDKDAGKAPKKS